MNYEQLQSLFISDPSAAIKESQKMICSTSKFDSFEDFTSYHLKNAHFYYCQKPFVPNYKPQITICCITCSKKIDRFPIICLDCFLNGNHEGHDYFIIPGFTNMCQCGNKDSLEKTGFCSKHPGCDDDNLDNYLNENLRTILTETIFKASLSALQKIEQTDLNKYEAITNFIISFFELGDGFRRLFVLTLTEEKFFNDLIYNITDYPKIFHTKLFTLFTYIMHDQLFVRSLSKISNKLIFDKIIKESPKEMIERVQPPKYDHLFPFIFVCFSEEICRYNIESNNWDWVTFCLEILKYYKELIALYKKFRYSRNLPVFKIIEYIRFMTDIQPHEPTQIFFDKLFTEVLNTCAHQPTDTIILESFKKFSLSIVDSYIDYLSYFDHLMISFKSKESLKFDSLFEELEKNVDINPLFMIGKNSVDTEKGKYNENDKLIQRFIIKKEIVKTKKSFFDKFKTTMKNLFDSFPAKYYKSFYNGASFYLCHPLYDSLAMLLKVDDLCRIKIARFLSTDKYQQLRIRLAILTLKKLLSFLLYKVDLVRIRNFSLVIFYEKIMELKKEDRYNVIPISFLQLLIGLQNNEKKTEKNIDDEFIIKEFFAFELAREIGLFEESGYSKKKKLMIFTFFYVSMLLVIDRDMFNYDHRKIIEEKLIFGLKKGVHSIDELNKICDIDSENASESLIAFNETLMKVATKSARNEEANNENETNITLNEYADSNSNNNDDKSSDDNDDDEDDDNEDKESISISKNELAKLRKSRKDKDKESKDKKKENSYIKPVNFYLKEGIQYKTISAINAIEDQKSFMNIEISKKPNKLLKIQDFESEETYFFKPTNDNDNNAANADGLKIRLREFLLTPTVFAVVYDSLRFNSGVDSSKSELNDHLAMNVLVLIARFISEYAENSRAASTKLDPKATIQYLSLSDFITKLKRVVFNYRVTGKEEDEAGFIDNTLNPALFASLLNMKIEPLNHQPKSIINILMNKGQLGQDALHQISHYVHIDELDNIDKKEKDSKKEQLDQKAIQKQRANKLKEDIMNQYSNIRNQYHFSDSISDSFSLSNSGFITTNNNEVCSLCSEQKKKEILCYPLYIYRTKFPFIVDKPPLVNSEDFKDEIAVYDNEEDFDKDTDLVDFLSSELSIQGEASEDELVKLSKFKKIMSNIFDQQKVEKEDLKIENEKQKRVTLGANFIVQYGICPHPVHKSCVQDGSEFVCPIDRSKKNGFLPSLEDIPHHLIFKDLKSLELNENKDSLSANVIESINDFVNKFMTFFDCLKEDRINVFIELIKSVSGLIETYEIRVRNLPDSLDSTKTKILSRNLFLTVWYAYRIQKKPKISIFSKSSDKEIDTDERLTDFQRFIKKLIEYDEIDAPEIGGEVKTIANSIVTSILSNKERNAMRNEKEVNLFLRRVCLAEYFLLDEDVSTDKNELLDWDDVLSTGNLSQRYNVKFESISEGDEFDFKPFTFANLPKEFLKLARSPYNLPIENFGEISVFNILDYNYMIKYYNDFDDTEDENSDNNNNNNNNNNDSDNASTNDNNNTNTDNSNDNDSTDNDNDNDNTDNDNDNDNTDNDNDNDNTDNDNDNDNTDNDNDVGDEVKRYRRSVHVCEDEFLPFFMTFYGKLHYPSILMFTGIYASQILLVDQSQGASLETFYVDKTGCPDINHLRFQALFLNEERYEKLIDQILSGDFSYNLSPLEDKTAMNADE